MFPNLCGQIYGFRLGLGIRLRAKYIYTKPSPLYYTIIVCYCQVTGDG